MLIIVCYTSKRISWVTKRHLFAKRYSKDLRMKDEFYSGIMVFRYPIRFASTLSL